jgi:hypothetical protein
MIAFGSPPFESGCSGLLTAKSVVGLGRWLRSARSVEEQPKRNEEQDENDRPVCLVRGNPRDARSRPDGCHFHKTASLAEMAREPELVQDPSL